jgi:hypothetical protein
MSTLAESTLSQRLLEVYQELKNRARVKSKSEFARIVGFQNTHWSEYESGKRRFTHNHVMSLVNHFGDVSRTFLETGEGKIFTVPVREVQPITFLNELPSVELPFVSVHARASYIGLGGASVDARNFDTVHLTLMSPDEATKYEGAVVFEVNGDSMQPLLHSGQRVIAWPLDEAKWEQIHNKVCVVAYDDTVTIKAVRSNDLFTKNMLVLHALDERVGYLPVSRRSIRSIWFVDEFFDRPKVRL